MTASYLTDDYVWLVVMGALASFSAAFGIGANDVANSLATAVGSKAITKTQAVFLAAFFEFFGSILLGSHVTKTIRKGIADQECFEDNPALLMYGMMCVLFAVAIWLYLATKWRMPVSTTHSCVGGIVGMTVVLVGTGCVTWYKKKDDFPFVGGVAGIVVSWFVAPVLSCAFATVLFLFVRTFILRSEHSYERAYKFYPFLVFVTLTVCGLFIIFKGAKGTDLDLSLGEAFAVSTGFAFVVAMVMIPTVLPWIRRRIDEQMAERENALEAGEKQVEMTEPEKKNVGVLSKISHHVSKNLNRDSHAIVLEDATTAAVHDNCEVFDEKTEMFFRYVQVFTCCCDSFSHGANDVANSIGPFAAIYVVYNAGEVSKKNELGDDAYWILALGAVGIVIGLAIYGYKIMEVLGTQMVKCTPSRGFSIELGAVAVVIMGTRLGIPLSTTHCQVGATCGVAWCEGKQGINYKVLFTVIAGWVLTLLVAGGTAGIFSAMGAYAPSAHGVTFEGMKVAVPVA